jgi:hypothetical protein
VASNDLDKTGKRENPTLDLTLLDPFAAKGRKLATLPGTGWGDFVFSPDDKRIAMIEYKSVNESYVWVMDVATGKRTRVLPRANATGRRSRRATCNSPQRPGTFLTTDRDGNRAARVPGPRLRQGRYFEPAAMGPGIACASPDKKRLPHHERIRPQRASVVSARHDVRCRS